MATQNIRRNRVKGPTVRGRQMGGQPQKANDNVAYGMMAGAALLFIIFGLLIAWMAGAFKPKKKKDGYIDNDD